MSGNKVAIVADSENFFKSFKEATGNLHGVYIDFNAMDKYLAGGRDIVNKTAYSAIVGNYDVSPGLLVMERNGYNLHLRRCGKVQKGVDIDVALAIRDLADSDDCDTIMLISGDGDFTPAVDVARKCGKRVEVAAFINNMSLDLAKAADRVHFLDEIKMVRPVGPLKKYRAEHGEEPAECA